MTTAPTSLPRPLDGTANVTAVTVSTIPQSFTLTDFGLNITNIKGVTPSRGSAPSATVTITVSNGEYSGS